MNRQERRSRRKDRHFRVEADPRSQPDLHKLAQVFLGMAIARAKRSDAPVPDTGDPGHSEPDNVE
ncbi:hypothetical protein GCM10027064_10520 [Microbacterium petrolearium]